MTEKITRLTKSSNSSTMYIEASEVRKLKAIDETGREHEVRERMEDEARRLEDKLNGGTTTEVKVEVIKSPVEGEEDNTEKPRVKQA